MNVKNWLKNFMKAHFWTFVIYLLFLVIFFKKIDGPFIYIYVRQAIPWCIALLGEMVILLLYQIDFSVGGQLCLLTVLLGWMYSTAEVHIVQGTMLILLVSILFGVAFAYLHEKLKMNTFVFTIAFQMIFVGLSDFIRKFITTDPNLIFKFIMSSRILVLPIWLIIGISSAIIAFVILNFTTIGRMISIVKHTGDSIANSDINIMAIKRCAFVLSTLLIGISAILFYNRIGNTINFNGYSNTFDILTAAGIGGIYKLRNNNLVQRSLLGGFGVIFLNALLQHLHIPSAFAMCLGGVIIITSFSAERLETKEYHR